MKAMKTFVITKKGYGSIEFRFYEEGDKYTMFINGVEVRLFDKEHCLRSYQAYIGEGWTLKKPAEKKQTAEKQPTKKAAPAPKKVEKTREEALTEKYGDKESRKAYMKAKVDFHRFYANKYKNLWGKEFHEKVDSATSNALKKWEEAGRPAYSC